MAVNRAPHFCNHAGCRALTAETYCPEHARMHEVRVDLRESSDKRGYDSRWQQVRARFLRRNPLCEHCLAKGRAVMAGVAHHVVPISEGGPRLDPRNLQALCRDCHEVVHGRRAERRQG